MHVAYMHLTHITLHDESFFFYEWTQMGLESCSQQGPFTGFCLLN